MQNHERSAALVACCSVGALLLTACSSNDKPKPAPVAAQPVVQSSYNTKEGVAGSQREDVIVVETIVTGVDMPNHRVTLKGPEGREYSFDVSPQIKDLSQLKVNDKVTATFTRRVDVSVKRDDAQASETLDKTWGGSGMGEMPGRLSAQETKKVGRVVAIDTQNRTADVQFVDAMKRIPVRSDVDLSNYKVGDNVVIRVTTALTVLSKSS
jgi:hypothetical protein